MIALALAVLGCSSPPPTGPHAPASERAAAKLCEVFTGAGHACAQEPGGPEASVTIEAAGHTVELTAVIEDEQTALGITSVILRVDPRIDGQARPELATPAAAYGGEPREELLDRAFHEWAVVYGVALADALIDAPERPALKAVERGEVEARALSGRPVYRGWSLLQGTSERSLDHDAVLTQLAPALGSLGPGWHGVGVRIDHEPGATRWRCDIDGADSPALCEAARGYAWPIGGPMSRVRQFYVIGPAPAGGAAPASPEG